MKLRSFLTLTSLLAAACGDDGGTTPAMPDAPRDIGFTKPTAALKANKETAPNTWTELGPADLSCLGMPASDLPTTVAVALTTKVRDFQSNNPVPNAAVTVFRDQDVGSPVDTKTADGNADVTVTIPVGTKRFGFKMTEASALDTLLLNQRVEPGQMAQMLPAIQSVSKTTATLLPALIGSMRTAGTGVLAGAMYDCQRREISNFIATVSSTRGSVTHLAGADTYYFLPDVGLPAKHNQHASATSDGLFMVIELAAAPAAFVQVWGYPTDADLAGDNLKLIAELPTPVISDTVITGSLEPLRTP
ncbi:MAG TPA: hypothetical protein VN253_02460 [Kofleriaceae bacterium]|nr:hypothetical protein [Kofleriaceae bacterium]